MSSILLSPELLHKMPLPKVEAGADKHERGRVFIVGSSQRVPGAVLLSGTAAMRAGAGAVQIATPGSIALPIGLSFPEAAVLGIAETGKGNPSIDAAAELAECSAKADATLIGPGIMDDGECGELAHRLLSSVRGNFVLDAAALHGVLKRGSGITRQEGRVILTPHAGEMAKILNVSRQAVEEAPEAAARTVSQALNCVVVLKGATSFICDARGSMFRNEHGAVGLGTGGSGDVLAGLIAGLFARGAEPLTATLWGVYVHAHIGTILTDKVGTLGFLAREIVDEIPGVLSELVEQSSLATR